MCCRLQHPLVAAHDRKERPKAFFAPDRNDRDTAGSALAAHAPQCNSASTYSCSIAVMLKANSSGTTKLDVAARTGGGDLDIHAPTISKICPNANSYIFGTNVPPHENIKIAAKLLISLKPTFQKRRELSNSGERHILIGATSKTLAPLSILEPANIGQRRKHEDEYEENCRRGVPNLHGAQCRGRFTERKLGFLFDGRQMEEGRTAHR